MRHGGAGQVGDMKGTNRRQFINLIAAAATGAAAGSRLGGGPLPEAGEQAVDTAAEAAEVIERELADLRRDELRSDHTLAG